MIDNSEMTLVPTYLYKEPNPLMHLIDIPWLFDHKKSIIKNINGTPVEYLGFFETDNFDELIGVVIDTLNHEVTTKRQTHPLHKDDKILEIMTREANISEFPNKYQLFLDGINTETHYKYILMKPHNMSKLEAKQIDRVLYEEMNQYFSRCRY